MPLHFDENSVKYSHCCCHVRIAAIVICVIQFLNFLCDLIGHTILLLNNKEGSDYSYGNFFMSDVGTDNDTDNLISYPTVVSENAAVGGLLWNAMIALTVLMSLYGIRRTRPFFMIPQLVMHGSMVGICFMLAVMILILGSKSAILDHLWFPFMLVMIVASVYAYFFHVFIRTFQYLSDKRRYINDPVNIYVLPFGRGLDHVLLDVPPAYPGLLTEDEISKERRVKQAKSKEPNALPSYEESLKLQPKNVDNV